MRRVLIALAASALAAAPALAGDYADREVVGFSAGGGIFIFDEYGVQDGSGFPYSNMYFIDTATDSWLPNTPIRVRIEDDTKTVQDARVMSWDQSVPILGSLNFGGTGTYVLSRLVTDVSPTAEFLLTPYIIGTEGYTLTIDTTEMASPNCPDMGVPIVGFDLTLTAPSGDSRVLNHDTRIPESRGCPVDYGISDVVTYDRENDTVVVILINVYKIGFEGPDRRYIAIPTTIPHP